MTEAQVLAEGEHRPSLGTRVPDRNRRSERRTGQTVERERVTEGDVNRVVSLVGDGEGSTSQLDKSRNLPPPRP